MLKIIRIFSNFEIFKDIIYKNFNDNYMNIYNNIQKYKDMETKKITISFMV